MVADDKYQYILEQFRNASTDIQILPVNTLAAEKLHEHLKFNPRSYFGIVLNNTGGIIIDNWIRIYGSGEIDFAMRNQELSDYGVMIIAEDIVGGLFAMGEEGELSYFAPESLQWEVMSIPYNDFLHWVTEKERINLFYETFRFEDWENVCKGIKLDQGIGYFPFLWAESDGKERYTELVSIMEIHKLQLEFAQEM